ncbi:hypothetical protein DFH11DRAFT_1557256 [Phellopilus nigrolimitatus]|nr:hypothetical protein DFH11DRAFT_1557256 [Phellopilus nigrolimitatus]
MLLDVAQRSLITYPTPIYLAMAFGLGLFALQSSPSFIPLVLLLATLRLFVTVVIAREHAYLKLGLAVACLAASTTLANLGTSLDAIPEVHTTTAVFALFALTCVTNSLALGAILIDTVFRPSDHYLWTHFIVFPTVWSTSLQVASALSPLGYIATWTPALGVHAYSWMRPSLGPSGIDWAVGAWAVVISEMMGVWIMGPKSQQDIEQEEHLISISEDNAEDSERPRRSLWLFYITALLCIGVLPSYVSVPLPTSVNSKTTVPFPIACAHPYIENLTREPSFDEYLRETQTLTPLAKVSSTISLAETPHQTLTPLQVVLWPEGAVRFTTAQIKAESIGKIARHAMGSVIGVAFEDYGNSSDKIRNGVMLIDKDGVKFEYFKRHLVPCESVCIRSMSCLTAIFLVVESNLMVSSEPPVIFDYELVTKRNSRNKPTDTLTVALTASICLDFAHPRPFNSLLRRPTLILAPARTWHQGIGAAMWEQAQARAEEVGSAVLWCDGGAQGIGGVGGRGQGSGTIVQVGPGSWVHTIGLETTPDDGRTLYATWGPWLSMALIWYVFGMERIAEWLIMRVRGGPRMRFGMRLPREAMERIRAWRRGRQRDDQIEAGERTNLLQ